jgi:hypothetical protein
VLGSWTPIQDAKVWKARGKLLPDCNTVEDEPRNQRGGIVLLNVQYRSEGLLENLFRFMSDGKYGDQIE